MNKNKKYKLNYLSEGFYEKYDSKKYPEMENKQKYDELDRKHYVIIKSLIYRKG